MLRGAADPLSGRFIETFDQAFFHRPKVHHIATSLDLTLQLLDDCQAPRFFFFGNLVVQRKGGACWDGANI